MKRQLTYSIDASWNGLRIYDFLCQNGYSRHIRTYLKQHPGSVLLNHEPSLFYFPLSEGDLLEIILEEEESSEKIPPVFHPLSIIYEDKDLLIIDKPADMPVHPSIGNYENTLANAVAWHYQSQGIPFVFRCINRLDRDTTGLLILAKHMLSAAILSEQMKQRKIHRTYLSLVEGKTELSGTIDTPIGRVDDSLILRKVDPVHGESACTHYWRLAYHPPGDFADPSRIPPEGLSLIKLQLETGRTHQIRVHLTSIGHPLIGDTLYNPETTLMKRQALHSSHLAFTHPITGEWMEFSSPLPPDMAKWQ